VLAEDLAPVPMDIDSSLERSRARREQEEIGEEAGKPKKKVAKRKGQSEPLRAQDPKKKRHRATAAGVTEEPTSPAEESDKENEEAEQEEQGGEPAKPAGRLSRRAASQISFKEPPLNRKMRQVKREKRGGGGGCSATEPLLLPVTMGGGSGSSEPRFYECESCNKRFARKAPLQRHEKAHSDFRPFVCTICEQKFKRKEHCFKHI